MSLFIVGLYNLYSKEGRVALLLKDMDILFLMIYVEQVEQQKFRYMEKYRNKKSNIGS